MNAKSEDEKAFFKIEACAVVQNGKIPKDICGRYLICENRDRTTFYRDNIAQLPKQAPIKRVIITILEE